MDLSGFLVFCGVYAMATFSPGPAVAAIVARTLAVGARRTAPFIFGVIAGDLVWFALVALGLAALAQNFQTLFLVIKYAGVAYLLYLAFKLWTAPADAPKEAPQARGEGWKLFLGGLALTMGNAKVMVFFVSILPLVVDLAALTPLLAMELAVTMMLILSAAMWTYALAASRARRLISSPRAMRLVNRGTGAVMAGAAVAVAARS
ncbi:MAG: LysE family translocator [Phreatobacter sp.]|uniref:LysE family translocator n=1 Tax=Phreatobacter sp. TaxID=1966341 RepID=UPI001A523E54|nr:LysE family translocator [Phreatobacter sp.]MBL8570600.1 LysE family translocator [Phreatobacter sp.]